MASSSAMVDAPSSDPTIGLPVLEQHATERSGDSQVSAVARLERATKV